MMCVSQAPTATATGLWRQTLRKKEESRGESPETRWGWGNKERMILGRRREEDAWGKAWGSFSEMNPNKVQQV